MEIPRGQTGSGPVEKPIDPKHGQSQRLFPAPQRLGVFIGGFAPGTSPFSFDPGSAVLIRAGSTIVLQMHYTTNGKEAIDRTKVGFYFAKQPPQTEMRLGTLVNGQLKIPAGEKDYSISADMTTLTDVTLRSLLPHTHLRGKSWEYTAIYPDGRSEVILSVPKYRLQLADRLHLRAAAEAPEGDQDPRGRALRQLCQRTRSNPDPTVDVAWGDQTWEEMMFTGIVYSIDGVKPGETVITTRRARTAAAKRKRPAIEADQRDDGGTAMEQAREPLRSFVAGAFLLCGFALCADAHDRITTRVTWDREIAPIFSARCVECHRAGGRSTIAAGDVPAGAAVGGRDQGRSADATDAEVERGARIRRLRERPVAVAVRDRADRSVGRRRRARERKEQSHRGAGHSDDKAQRLYSTARFDRSHGLCELQ